MGIRRGSISTPIIADGLIYNFDPANRASYPVQRTLAISESGSCYNTLDLNQSGSFISDPQFITQPISASCWVFDGVDDYIETTTTENYLKTTLSMWIKTSKLYTTVNENYGLFGGGNWPSHGQGGIGDTEWSADYLYIRFQPGGYVTAKPDGTDANHPTIGIVLNDNVWHHCVWTYSTDGSSMDIDVYVDGNNQISYANRTSYWSYYIAYKKFSTGLIGETGEFEGEIANIHIYNRKLSQSEVLHNYNALKGRFS